MVVSDHLLALAPLVPPLSLMIPSILTILTQKQEELDESQQEQQLQLIAFLVMAVIGFLLTNSLVPTIRQYTGRQGISGKDLGKKGTPLEDKNVPEALGIVPGTVFLMCLIVGSMWFYTTTTTTATPTKLLDVHSALLSICFMLFLGFTDDVLNWPWRYKLILPTVASLPLLCCYNGSTTIVVPIPLRPWIVQQQSESGASLTWLGQLASWFITVDPSWGGKIVDLGWWYLLYMSLLAVFCTNAINIYAGINGLEAGQAYVMACFVLIHNLIEMRAGGDDNNDNDYHLFSILLLLPFCGVTLGLLRYNWYPAQVFVGDTYCYFAGMTFAVVGILGHFSKTLLLFFLPQIVNFLWSCPQLFHLVPCPRHRLPRYDAALGKMVPSTFACEAHRLRFLKKRPTDTVCPNMTVINLCLQFCGPLTERTLCLTLLGLQVVSCTLGLFCRYYVAQFFFE